MLAAVVVDGTDFQFFAPGTTIFRGCGNIVVVARSLRTTIALDPSGRTIGGACKERGAGVEALVVADIADIIPLGVPHDDGVLPAVVRCCSRSLSTISNMSFPLALALGAKDKEVAEEREVQEEHADGGRAPREDDVDGGRRRVAAIFDSSP